MTAASGFVNRDSSYATPDLHSGKLFGRLRGRREEGMGKRKESKGVRTRPCTGNVSLLHVCFYHLI